MDIYKEQVIERKEYDEKVMQDSLMNIGKVLHENKDDTELKMKNKYQCRMFPNRKLTLIDLLIYMKNNVKISSVFMLIISIILSTLIGMFIPRINKILFSTVLPMKNLHVLYCLFVFFFSISLSTRIIDIFKNVVTKKISVYMDTMINSAVMMRVLSLPMSFFNKYAVGDIKKRMECVEMISQVFISTVFSTGITAIFSIVYIFQIGNFSKHLVIPSFLSILVIVCFLSISSLTEIIRVKKKMKLDSKLNGIVYPMLVGIQKIKTAAAEKRAFARWLNVYTQNIDVSYNLPFVVLHINSIVLFITLISNVIFECIAVKTNITIGDYFAFLSAYSLVSQSFIMLSNVVLSIAKAKPAYDMVKPIFDIVPENMSDEEVKITGDIEISHLYFKYDDNYVFDDFNLKIKKGEYVAIVGETGCGKSTLIKLLLGFLEPERGAIYYDKNDLKSINVRAFRKNIGVVLQNGRLMPGSIASNIAFTGDESDKEKIWEAARIASVDTDIKNMPMQMETIISEGAGGISGGQRQRILIARAVMNNPKIMIFDEATSNLDNVTQKKVMDEIGKFKTTRIVIAHRLSTIKLCDRIIYLEKGKIIEDGTYDELMNLNGKFREMVDA